MKKAHFGMLGCGGLLEQLSPKLCPLSGGRTEELSVCPRAVPVNRTGGLGWVSTLPTWECLWMW